MMILKLILAMSFCWATSEKSNTNVTVAEVRATLDAFPKNLGEKIQLIQPLAPGLVAVQLLDSKGVCREMRFDVLDTPKGRKAVPLARQFECQKRARVLETK